MILTRLRIWMAKKPATKPIILFLNGAGNANMAANKMITASSPLQPRSMRTPNPETLSRITLPVAMTLSSKACTIQTLISATIDVNGRMMYFSAGCKISSVNSPISSIENMIKNRSIKPVATPVGRMGAMVPKAKQACTPFVRSPGSR